MASYILHDYRKDWVAARKAAHLDETLFKKDLEPMLDELNRLYGQLVKAAPADTKALYDQHGRLAAKVKKVVAAYRAIVTANGANAQALRVLDTIDGVQKGAMLWDMDVDKATIARRFSR